MAVQIYKNLWKYLTELLCASTTETVLQLEHFFFPFLQTVKQCCSYLGDSELRQLTDCLSGSRSTNANDGSLDSGGRQWPRKKTWQQQKQPAQQMRSRHREAKYEARQHPKYKWMPMIQSRPGLNVIKWCRVTFPRESSAFQIRGSEMHFERC